MKVYNGINSNLEALKLKEIEKYLYSNISENEVLIPKVIPFKGVYADLLYIKDNSLLFIKFMDTTEDVFTFLDEEILEILKEEYETLKNNMFDKFDNIKYNYVFVFPYIEEVTDKYGMDEFIDNHILCSVDVEKLKEDRSVLERYLKEGNEKVENSLFIYSICSEYYTLTDGIHLNPFFKTIHFNASEVDYKVCMLEEKQIYDANSINYGREVIYGGSGTGKSTLILSRMIKLAKIYPQHKFLLLTFTKQQANKYRELLEVLNSEYANLEIFTFSSFIFRLAKANDLVINYDMLKKNYDKTFQNIIKQIENMMKNKKMYKGIFVDEAENFNSSDIELINKFLYSTKSILNVSICKSYNINNNLNIYKDILENIEFDTELVLKKNYRQSDKIVDFVNSFCDRVNEYISSLYTEKRDDIFYKTEYVETSKDEVNIIRVEDLDDQINAVIWELNHLVKDMGYTYDEVSIVYPYNKKRLKNGKNIYFQYMLRKALEEAKIPYIYADDTITNITKKDGVTLSNIYSIKSLSYKAVIVCELEMLYNQMLPKDYQEYNVNDFVGDLNKVYTALTRAEKQLKIVVSYTKESSKIIELLGEN